MLRTLAIVILSLFATACLDELPPDTREGIPTDDLGSTDQVDIGEIDSSEPVETKSPADSALPDRKTREPMDVSKTAPPGSCVPKGDDRVPHADGDC